MSIHSSLRGIDTLVGERSVLTRTERLQILIKQGKVDPKTGSVYRLPKVRTRFKIAGVKKAPKPAAGAAPGEGAAAAPAAPAAEPKAEAKGKEAKKK
jgi:small basic protein (TIGR04137 family)